MEYTIIVDGRSYDLPKKTLAVMEKLDDVLMVDSVKGLTVKQKFEKLHAFVKDLVGEDNASEMFGTDNLSEIDLSELTLAVKKVVSAYEKPIADYDAEIARKKFDNVPIEKIVSLTKAAQTVSAQQANKK